VPAHSAPTRSEARQDETHIAIGTRCGTAAVEATPATRSAHETVALWLSDVHDGAAFGPAAPAIVSLCGLSPLVLLWSGAAHVASRAPEAAIGIASGMTGAGTSRWFRWNLAIHRWSSVLGTVPFLVLCLTGTVLIFHDEIDAALGVVPASTAGESCIAECLDAGQGRPRRSRAQYWARPGRSSSERVGRGPAGNGGQGATASVAFTATLALSNL
jgi:uncharacterized iron-regulated membrane protein